MTNPAADLILPEQSPMQARQDARLEAVPELYRQKHERLAIELAMGMDDADAIFARHGYDKDQAVALVGTPAFLALLQRTAEEVKTSGASFRMKARAQAEELLGYSFELATDPSVSSATRLDAIQWTAKMGDLEPKGAKDDGKTGGGLTLSITFSGQQPQTVVAGHEPLTIEQS